MTFIQFLLYAVMIPGLAIATAAHSGDSDLEQIETVIAQYVAGGDEQDVSRLEAVIHSQFRVVFHVNEEQTISLDRDTYLGKIRDKEFGGDSRTINIESIDIKAGKTAVARLVLRGEQATLSNFICLTKEGGSWRIVSDLVFMAP